MVSKPLIQDLFLPLYKLMNTCFSKCQAQIIRTRSQNHYWSKFSIIQSKPNQHFKINPEYLSFCSTFPKQLQQNPQATREIIIIIIIIYSATKQSITQKINWPRELGCSACELGGRGQCAGVQGSWLCFLLAPTDQELGLHWRKGPP